MTEYLQFGDIRFCMNTPPGLHLTRLDELYTPFLQPRDTDDRATAFDFDITLKRGPYPTPGELEPVFDGESWALHRSGDTRVLVAPSGPPSAGSYWVTALAPDLARATVWVGSDFRPHADPAAGCHLHPVTYPLDQLLAIHALAPRGGLLVHGAGAVLQGRGVVFPGVSRAGKSTLAKLLIAAGYGENLLSDDRVILRERAGGWQAFGTPWPGEAGIAADRAAPLHAIAFLRQADENRFVPLSAAEALRRLLPVTSVPWHDEALTATVLDTCDAILSRVPCYAFHFRPEPAAAHTVATFMQHGI